MVRRGMMLLVVGAVTILAACGSQDEEPEPTVTRIPNPPNAPATPEPTTDATTPAESPATSPAGSPAASPVGSPIASPVASPDATAPAPPAETRVVMRDIFFEPEEFTIPANTDVTVSLVNEGAAVHNFNIDELDVQSGDYQSGQTGSVTINAAPGEYEYYCSIPGHREAGMVGRLIVQ